MKHLFDDIWSWSVYSKDKRLDFNGHVIRSPDETVLVDPPAMDPQDLEKIRWEPAPFHIVLTGKDHERDSAALRDHLDARLWIHADDAGALERECDATFQDGERLPGGLRAVQIPDNKTPGETAFHLERHGGVLILGDALIGSPLGELRLLPAGKYADPGKAREGIGVLRDLEFETVLVGDGTSIFRNGRDALRRFLEEA